MTPRRNLIIGLAFVVLGIVTAAVRAADIPSGGDYRTAVKAGGVVRLERGGSYSLNASAYANASIQLSIYGDPAKPRPVVHCSGATTGLGVDGKSNITIDSIDFDGTGTTAGPGIRILNAGHVRITGCNVHDFGGMGITVEAYGGKRCSDVLIQGNAVWGNWPAGAGHVSGLFVSYTDGLVVDGNVFDANGYGHGKPATVYNHNVYLHGTNGLAGSVPVVTNNVFARASSHGLQQRSGGISRGNIFIDNPVGQSFGLVNGEAAYPGGVTGDVTGNVYVGSGSIAGSPRGWALELSNAKDVKVSDLIIAGDKLGAAAAIQVQNCQRLTNPGRELPAARWNLSLSDVYVWDWPAGPIAVGAGSPTKTRVGITPPIRADPHAALGANFLASARLRPASAAGEGIAAVRRAVGLDAGAPPVIPPPPVTQPTTPPMPPPVAGETLESIIRKQPSDVSATIENGEAIIKAARAGTDPRWVVKGDSVVKK